MPATTETLRNMKQLHRIFAASGALMLAATIWMLAKDHYREWKTIQRRAAALESTVTAWKQVPLSTRAKREEYRQRREALQRASDQPLDPAAVEGFLKELHSEATTQSAAVDTSLPRDKLLAELRRHVSDARFREERCQRGQKEAASRRDEAVARITLAIRDQRPQHEQQQLQREADRWRQSANEAARRVAAASEHRQRLEQWLNRMTAEESSSRRALETSLSEWQKVQSTLTQRRSDFISWNGWLPLPGKRVLELPIVDLFNSPRKIETLWGEGLQIDYNLVKVQRYDRCTTCHQFVGSAGGGRGSPGAFPPLQRLEFTLEPATAGEPPAEATPSETPDEQLDRIWGIRLAHEGLWRPEDVCVQYVWPNSPSARARHLAPGSDESATGRDIRRTLLQSTSAEVPPIPHGLLISDVIERVQGAPIRDRDEARQALLDAARSNGRVTLTVRRGLPSPYASHPRPDLFVSESSPHPMSTFGCTICHEGQGSGTEFKWVSHTPNDPQQREHWMRQHRWFDNPDWRFPMFPHRFSESGCLKCHPTVTELGVTDRFATAPAPKLTRGHQLIRTYGCFGCHEYNGLREGKLVSPDLRLEPNYAAAAQQLGQDKSYAGSDPAHATWLQQIVRNPDQPQARHFAADSLLSDASRPKPQFSRESTGRLAALLRDVEQPGTLRQVGPSLRSVKAKLEPAFLYEWIRRPRKLRPATRMPQPFGLWEHLGEQGRGESSRYEPLEILGIVTYLLEKSQPLPHQPPPEGISPSSAEEKVARGKRLFQERGCLACHAHRDFEDAEPLRDKDDRSMGPELSGLAGWLRNDAGREWLYNWIQRPTLYHPRSRMPEPLLDPIQLEDGRLTDPVADIVAYLLSPTASDWRPEPETLSITRGLDSIRLASLDSLTLEQLRDQFSEDEARRVLKSGFPSRAVSEVSKPEEELAPRPGATAKQPTTLQKLLYVGRKSLNRYGCFACHDIPGLEDAKAIGPTMNDWGRKDEQQLAFESVASYLDENRPVASELPGFYLQQIQAGHRAGFAYQKLREPRSYDYRRTENKRYTERLRMPQFSFSDADREAIVTFLLGIVADPPVEPYVFRANAARRAELAGQDVMDVFRCKSCHAVRPEQWRVTFEPGQLASRSETAVYPFLRAHFTPGQIAASKATDASGLGDVVLEGVPTLAEDGLPRVFDDEGLPLDDASEYSRGILEYSFDLWKSAVLDGSVHEVGVQPLMLPADTVWQRRGAEGGFLARYLLPHVVRRERETNSTTKGNEAWGWLPPSLHGEGRRVQTGWLHDYLLNPVPIRPAVLMRMPRYNLSSREATDLAQYFAVRDGAAFPYEHRGRRQADYLAQREHHYQQAVGKAPTQPGDPGRTRLSDGMRVVTDSNFCVKCHRIGDFEPQVAIRSRAPDLLQVHQRLRPDFVRDWIANPSSVLPYTGMPVNIPYRPDQPHLGGIAQDLAAGTSIEQIDVLVDLLMNYDEFAKLRVPISPSVKLPGAGQSPKIPDR